MTSKEFILSHRNEFSECPDLKYVFHISQLDKDFSYEEVDGGCKICDRLIMKGDQEYEAASYLKCLNNYFDLVSGIKLTLAASLFLMHVVKYPVHCRILAEITSVLSDKKYFNLLDISKVYFAGLPNEKFMSELWDILKMEWNENNKSQDK